jgi:hypothetical protein
MFYAMLKGVVHVLHIQQVIPTSEAQDSSVLQLKHYIQWDVVQASRCTALSTQYGHGVGVLMRYWWSNVDGVSMMQAGQQADVVRCRKGASGLHEMHLTEAVDVVSLFLL